ncbi:MFS transporter [Intrasporangium calvum]|uniref:MFS transporter n=1 Tax=Intrasporangium calvum TaxID=53358 RepID=UPI000DF6278F|nr:MFS transporter [Intrasporangium calvum]AXG14497.1 MFS transporter [Intrasporangium calvum]
MGSRVTSAAAQPPAQAAPLRRNRDFMLLWTGQAVSATGSNMAAVVYPLLALAATHSATLAGVVGFAGMSAAALMRLPAGVLADRFPLKPLMIVPELVRVATALWIFIVILVGRVTLAQLLVAAILGSVFGAVFDSAQAVAIRHVVPPEQLPQALAQDAARGHLAGLAGQPLGGYLYGVGVAVPVLADAISSLVCAGLTARVRSPMRSSSTPVRIGTLWRDIPVGLRYVASSPFLRVTLACAGGFQVIFAGLTIAIIASYGARNGAALHLGTALSLGAIGGILGAWSAPFLNKRLSPSALVSLFGWTCCLALTLLGQVQDTYLVGALLALMFFVATPANATLFAAQIAITPPELQGRVVSASLLAVGIAAPIGPPLAGLLLERAGQAITFFLFAAIAAALTVVMQLSSPVRTMQRPGTPPKPTGGSKPRL